MGYSLRGNYMANSSPYEINVKTVRRCILMRLVHQAVCVILLHGCCRDLSELLIQPSNEKIVSTATVSTDT